MQIVFFSRLLEAIFRRWWLYLGAIFVFCLIGAYVVTSSSDEYRSTGILRVSGQSTLSEITRVGGNNAVGWETPAAFTAREINAVIGTDLFIESVAEGAGISGSVEAGLVSPAQIRRLIWASSSSDLLVQVNALAGEPLLAQALANATISSYLKWQVDDSISGSRSSEQFLQTLLTPYQERLDAAQQALEDYVAQHPGPANQALRPVSEQVQLEQLSGEVGRANDQLSTAMQSLADAQLVTAQAETDITQRMRVIDAPSLPTAPDSASSRQNIITMMMFFVLGTMISLAAAAAVALLDRTVRYPDEAEAHLDVPVLAVVPYISNRVGVRALIPG